jgi:predicted TIM-barrel fold metal-dependent hydrolase
MGPIPPAARSREARVAKLIEQGVDLAWVLPSLGLGLEEMLANDVEALYAVFHSYNQWLDEDWGYNRDNRILTGPLMSLIDPVRAEKELELAISKGARFVTFRPAPVQAPDRFRSLADPMYDRFWNMAADAGVAIAFHGADSGYGIYLERWGESLKYTGMKMSTLTEVMGVHIERPVFDLVASLICHGLFDRVPKLQIATVELGAGWVPDLLRRLKRSYGKTPQLYKRDPIETFCSNVSVAPFYEDDIAILSSLIGADRVLLGSDWPHPEGLAAPRDWVGDFAGLTVDERRLALRDNLRKISGMPL